jgi:endonuclease/exonuclease/phosphatase family metal-dependent hydrolase
MNFNTGYFESDTLRVMTFNIRLDVASDGVDRWVNRKGITADVFNKFNVDIAGVQEAVFDQVEDLRELLPGYNWFGVGRENGDKDGEFSAIFYRKSKLELIRGDTFWLSEHPGEAGSVGWDASITRICTWGEFKVLNTGKTFYLFNTHFDHKGKKAREKSAELILSRIKSIANDNTVILTGDFNFNRSSIPYKNIINNKTIMLQDAQFAEGAEVSGPEWTFHGFDSVEENKREKIDFIFINDKVKVLSHSILNYKRDGRYPSDHLPVVAEIVF